MHVLPVKVVDSDPLSPLGPLIGSPQSPAWDRDPPVAGSLIRSVAMVLMRDFPDHATFREKGAKLACADKLGVFLY